MSPGETVDRPYRDKKVSTNSAPPVAKRLVDFIAVVGSALFGSGQYLIGRKGVEDSLMEEKAPLIFEVIVHVMEVFVVIGIAASIYFVKKTKRQRDERKNTR